MGRYLNRYIMVRAGLVLLALLPVFATLHLVLKYGVNTPYWDQLESDIAGVMIKAKTGGLTLKDMAAQHNEHRMLVARVFFVGLGLITNWNIRVEIIFSWMILVATSFGLLWLIPRTACPGERWHAPRVLFLWLMCNLLFFTPAQQENLTLGIGIANVLPFAWMVAGLVVAESGLAFPTKVGLGILFSYLATWSSGNGVLAWVVIALPLFANGGLKQILARRVSLIVWGICGALCVGLYYFGYTTADHIGASTEPVPLGRYIHYFFAFLGNHFIWASPHPGTIEAASVGVFQLLLLGGCITYLVWCERHSGEDGTGMRARMFPWVAIALFAMLNALLASIFRANHGVTQATSSRYVIFSVQLPIALVCLIPIVVTHARARGRDGWWMQIPAALVGAVVLTQFLVIPVAHRTAGLLGMQREMGKGLIQLSKVAPEPGLMVRAVYPRPTEIFDELAQLNELGYINPPILTDPNAARLQPPVTSPGKVVDGAIERNRVAADSSNVVITGYAVFLEKRRPVSMIFLTYTNEQREPIIFAVANVGLSRADLTAARADPTYEYSGWGISLPLRRLATAPADTLIEAWAMDVHTGHAYKLDGAIPRQ